MGEGVLLSMQQHLVITVKSEEDQQQGTARTEQVLVMCRTTAWLFDTAVHSGQPQGCTSYKVGVAPFQRTGRSSCCSRLSSVSGDSCASVMGSDLAASWKLPNADSNARSASSSRPCDVAYSRMERLLPGVTETSKAAKQASCA